MKGRINNKFGSIQIDPEVIAMYAGTLNALELSEWLRSV